MVSHCRNTAVRRTDLLSPSIVVAALLMVVCAVQASAQLIPLPTIPDATLKITDFGAVGDGKSINTDAIQKTIDAAIAKGGGTVIVPAGTFVTGPIKLASKINLHVAKDATLLINNDIASYPITKAATLPPGEEDDPPDSQPKPGPKTLAEHYTDAITAFEAQDIEISGEGTIDGQGGVWWNAWKENRKMTHRPNLITLSRCVRLFVHDVTLKNSPMFNLITENCTDVTIENVKISAPWDSPNTDGIDFSGWNYLITGCTVDNGDDHIVAKPTSARQPGNRNITIHNCTLLHGRGICVGSTTAGGTEDMLVSYCTFKDSDYAIHIKSGRDRGGLVHNVRYENITMSNVRLPIFIQSYYSDERRPSDFMTEAPRPITTLTPTYRDVTIRNVTATDCPTAGRIQCLPEMPLINLTLENVHISAKRGMRIFHTRGMKVINSTVTAETGNPVEAFDAEIDGWGPVLPLPTPEPRRRPRENEGPQQNANGAAPAGQSAPKGAQPAPKAEPSQGTQSAPASPAPGAQPAPSGQPAASNKPG